jgi:hypothetical protein
LIAEDDAAHAESRSYMDTTQQEQLAIADKLYEQYGKPLESQHRGEYLAVSRDGRTLLASSLPDVVEQAAEAFGPENYIFKVGDKAVGKWLWLPAAS